MKLFRLEDGNYTNQKFNECALLPIALILACFAISLMAQAVIPAPDRCTVGKTPKREAFQKNFRTLC
jgi:hypothetical protein